MAMNPKDLLVWIKSMARGQALPLDASEVHESLKAAQDYAGTAIAYGGQTVKVKLDDGKYHEYILQPSDDGYRLEEIRGGGSAGIHVGDESSMPEGTVLHIDPDGEGYEMIELDTTLSKAGYAADANVTGEKFDELYERLDDIEQSGGTGGGGGGAFFVPGNALELTDDGTLNVKTTDEAETDNTLPITSSGVYTIVGNIGAILDTI